jgi:triacylglycerol esterase/lipase EstA (alpha/beta hydrolase family)
LLPILREKGFDVIIVNFPKYTTTNLLNGQNVSIDGGAYYIESNANAIIKLLQDVKQQVAQNGSTSKTSIIAPSMAGQISRYALSFMEKKFNETNNPIWQHNVSLWVSVDSPHLGANIPLGDQALIYLLKNENDTANDFYNLELSSPASQQQLIEFHRPQLVNNPWYPSLSNAPQIPN